MNARCASPIAFLALLLSTMAPVGAHQLDEYLQATILSVEKSVIRADMFLTPGVAVLSTVLADIDSNHDGILSPTEQRAYAERVLRDLSLTLDGARLPLRLGVVTFPDAEEMKAGRGDIHLEFVAVLPLGVPDRKLRLENHHHTAIAAYLVNCLVPRDPTIRIAAEQRNFLQSVYEVRFTSVGAHATSRPF